MDEFKPLGLPDLDSPQYEPAEAKDMRFKKFAHIEYVRKSDGSILRVCRPWGPWPIFFIPVKSLENEYQKDLDLINTNQQHYFPGYSESEGDEQNDNIWTNQNCFSNTKEDEQ